MTEYDCVGLSWANVQSVGFLMSLGPGTGSGLLRGSDLGGGRFPDPKVYSRCHSSDDIVDAVLTFVKVTEDWIMDSHSTFFKTYSYQGRIRTQRSRHS